MPIRAELRHLYPPNWEDISNAVRFDRARGRCERCRRPHLQAVLCLPDGRWLDQERGFWRDGEGCVACAPDPAEATRARTTRVVIATTHVEHDPTRSDHGDLRAWCQRCHLLHDRPYHLAQRWITYRRRLALGDLFLGRYDAAVLTAADLVDVLRRHRPVRPGATPSSAVVVSAAQAGFL